MSRLTITIPDDIDDELARRARTDERFESKADVVRAMIERGREADELRAALDEREERIERLERDLEYKDGQLDALRDAMERRRRLLDRIDRLVERADDRHRAALAPFFARWRRWWQLRGRSGDDNSGEPEGRGPP